jgi:hypothetical protein
VKRKRKISLENALNHENSHKVTNNRGFMIGFNLIYLFQLLKANDIYINPDVQGVADSFFIREHTKNLLKHFAPLRHSQVFINLL